MIQERHQLFIWSALTFVATLSVYIASMPTSITLEDAGLFQMVCHEGGIGHPPGYPVFVLTCQTFVDLPFFSTSVFAGNLLTAIFAALTCAILVPTIHELLADRVIAVVTALAYGFSATFWSQAIIIEVYSLAALMFVGCLWLCLIYRRSEDIRALFGLAFLYGLALANHWPLQILATPMLLTVLAPKWQELLELLRKPAIFVGLVGTGVGGLLPYLTLFQEAPNMAVYGGIETVDQFIKYVSRAAYDDQFPAATWFDKYLFQVWVWRETLAEFSYFLAPLLIAGFILSFRTLELHVAIGCVLLYLGGTSLLIALLGFEFSALRSAIFRPYPILAYLAAAVWLAIGCRWLMQLLAQRSRQLVAVLPVVFVLIIAVGNFSKNFRADDHFAASYSRQLLASVPEDAVLFVTGDTGVGAVGYLHHVVGLRPDLELRSWNSLVYSNRLTSAFVPQQILDDTRRQFVEQSAKPVFSNAQPDYPAINRGIVFEHSAKPGFDCDGSQHDYIQHLVQVDAIRDEILDAHEQELLFGLLMAFTRQHVGVAMFGRPSSEEYAVLQTLQQTFAGKLATLESLLQYPQNSDAKVLLAEMAEAAADSLPSGASSHVAGLVDEYRGRIALLDVADPERAVLLLQSSLEHNPTASNGSRCVLLGVLRRLGRDKQAKEIESEYGSCSISR